MMAHSLLVVSHSYPHPQWQEKFIKIAEVFSKIVIIHPHVHHSSSITYYPVLSSLLPASNVRFYLLFTFFVDSPTWYVYCNPLRFAWLFLKNWPSLVLLEEDPHSITGLLTLFLFSVYRAINPSAKLVIFTWDNINRQPSSIFFRIAKKLIAYVAGQLCNGLIAGSRVAEAVAKNEKYIRCPSVVLPLVSVPNPPYNTLKNLSSKPSSKINFVVGYVGRIVPEKGLITLFEACNQIALRCVFSLKVVGGGPFLASCKSHFTEMPSWISFTGAVPFEKVYEHLKEINVLVLPSIDTPSWREQFGLVLAQAMSLGIPCIGSDSGAIPDVIGDSSLIYRQKNSSHLAHILQILISSPVVYQQKSLQAQKRYAECFSGASVGSNYSTFLSGIAMSKQTFTQITPYGRVE